MTIKKIIDILGIALPAAIILLGIIRVFMQKTRGINGLTMFFAVLLLLAGIIRYLFFAGSGSSHDSGPKPPPLFVSKHSEAFNNSVAKALDTYFAMSDAFVKESPGLIHDNATALSAAFDSLKMDELKKDTLIYQTSLDPYHNAQSEIKSIIADSSLVEQRGSLNILSDNLRNLLVIVKYDRAKIYWQECATAFGEDRPGNWLSPAHDSGNPYGNSGSADNTPCGAPKDTINFVVADTTKR